MWLTTVSRSVIFLSEFNITYVLTVCILANALMRLLAQACLSVHYSHMRYYQNFKNWLILMTP